MTRVSEKWDRFYLDLAEFIANRLSKDPSTKVGAVLVNYQENKEFFGYNGFPRCVNDTAERYANRELKYKMVVHAEANAILKAGHYAKGSTLYVYPSFAVPNICNECAKLAIQAGVKEVVGFPPTDTEEDRIRRTRKRADGLNWEDSIAISKRMFDESGVVYRVITR